jgi:hypothetical protein
MVCDELLGLIIRCKQLSRDISGYHFFNAFNASLSFVTVYYLIIYSFLLFYSVNFIADN